MTRVRRAHVRWSIGLAAAALFSCWPVAGVSAERPELLAKVAAGSGAGVPVEAAINQPLVPNDRGTLYASAANGERSLLGISLNDPHSVQWAQMSDAAVKVSHGMVHQIGPAGDHQWPWFPYQEFITYEQAEVAAGRDPLRLTATYEGTSRPVYSNWSLGFPVPGERPAVADVNQWQQAVDIGDDRYIAWLLEHYVDRVMLHQYFTADGRPTDIDAPYPNEWLGMDAIAINYHLYGVLDDAGRWVPMDAGPTMDSPFPDGSEAFHDMFRYFFRRLHEVRPELRIMANLGSPDDWGAFPQDFADVDGLVVEEIFGSKQQARSDLDRALLLSRWSNIAAFADDGGVVLMRSLLDPAAASYETDLRSGLMGYLILSGENTAWAPQVPGQTELAPAAYQQMKSALGRATAPVDIRREGTTGAALYTRATENGVVYVNATGRAVSISCPAGVTCRDRSGSVVDAVSIPDLTGDYLLTSG
jgi:hypothetical protein